MKNYMINSFTFFPISFEFCFCLMPFFSDFIIFNIIISEKNGVRQKQNLNEIDKKVKELVG